MVSYGARHPCGRKLADAARAFMSRECVSHSAVGWVEHRETHHHPRVGSMGIAALNPSYNLISRISCR
jgi:hypothetical protein